MRGYRPEELFDEKGRLRAEIESLATVGERPAVKRGRMVNCAWGDPAHQLHERHDASDFDTKT